MTVIVNGERFEMWGFDGDGPVPALRLKDMAYIFNGTSAQFDIRTPPDQRWDYWIVRGAAYTPTGAELSLDFEHRSAVYGSYGFAGGMGFYTCPIRTVIVGIDGYDEPATTVALTAIEDPGGMFFDVFMLAPLLGIAWDWDAVFYYAGPGIVLTPGTQTPAQPLVQSPELVDILVRAGGHWTDRGHFYSPIIDESVVWPAEFFLSVQGIDDANFSAPIRNWEWPRWRYPVVMRPLENGYVELTVDPAGQPHVPWHELHHPDEIFEHTGDITRFYNRRIVFDASRPQIDEITYYVGDVAHRMIRNDWRIRHALRHYAAPAEGGGVVLRYVFWSMSSFRDELEFRVYRSTSDEERGEMVFSQTDFDFYDRILFEFVDNTAEYGQVYYYTFYAISQRGDHWRVFKDMGNRRSIVVDVNYVHGLPPEFTGEEIEDEEIYEPEDEPHGNDEPEDAVQAITVIDEYEAEYPSAPARRWPWILVAIAVHLPVIFIAYRKFVSVKVTPSSP